MVSNLLIVQNNHSQKTWTGNVGNKGTIKNAEAEWHQWLGKGIAITHSKVHDLQLSRFISLDIPKKPSCALQTELKGSGSTVLLQ